FLSCRMIVIWRMPSITVSRRSLPAATYTGPPVENSAVSMVSSAEYSTWAGSAAIAAPVIAHTTRASHPPPRIYNLLPVIVRSWYTDACPAPIPCARRGGRASTGGRQPDQFRRDPFVLHHQPPD